MTKFTIVIEEVVSEEFEINANTEEEARKIAEDAYMSGALVLEPGNLVSKKMTVVSHDGEEAKWINF